MKKLAALMIFILLLAAAFSGCAEDAVAVKVEVVYGQTEARSMLAMVNEFRRSGAACWNPDNKTKTVYSDLEDLVYDYELEKTAMQRAAELAAYYEHRRPDGRDWKTAFSGDYPIAENIAAANESMTTAKEAYTAWREDDRDYSGQSHRRAMLGDYNCIGIGHAVYNGKHYWTQAFGKRPSPATTPTEAVNGAKTVEISVGPEYVRDVRTEDYSLIVGYAVDFPRVTFSTVAADAGYAWESNEFLFKPVLAVQRPAWAVSDPDKLTMGIFTMKPLAAGQVSLDATVLGKEITSEVTIRAEGLVEDGGRKCLYRDGKFQEDYNGLYCDEVFGWVLIRNGTADEAYTGLWNDPVYGWWLISGGQICRDYTGLWGDPDYGWCLIRDGAIDGGYTGLYCDAQVGWWLIRDGWIDREYTGLWNDPVCGWWLISGGTICWDYCGLWNDPNCGWWLISGGTICWDYCGLWNDPVCGWWLIDGGTIAWGYTGEYEAYGNIWQIVNGQLVF